MIGYNSHDLQAPAPDEIEVSVFGPGYGESILCHVGNNNWFVIDSFLCSHSKSPIALEYLKSLGLNPTEAIKGVLATHWDDDHISGLADILIAAENADFCITSALSNKDFQVALSPWLENYDLLDGKGLSEFRKLIELGRKPILAKENSILFESNNSSRCRIVALSPSDSAVVNSIQRLRGMPIGKYRRKFPTISNNDCSVAVTLEIGERVILLGGDLEVSECPDVGWTRVIANHERFTRKKHNIFKIPHHGSPNGHDDSVWRQVATNPIAITTPFTRCKHKRPDKDDRIRIKRCSQKSYITSAPGLSKFRHNNKTVQKIMIRNSQSLGLTKRECGHVRLRGHFDLPESEWRVDLYNGAIQD